MPLSAISLLLQTDISFSALCFSHSLVLRPLHRVSLPGIMKQLHSSLTRPYSVYAVTLIPF